MNENKRSLGFSVIFAGCDLESLKRTSKGEAKTILANSNTKIKLKDNK